MKRRKNILQISLIENSPLRSVDPRVKLVLSLFISLTVMLPFNQLLTAIGLSILLMWWAKVFKSAAQQLWRIKWVLIILFIVDWLFVSLSLAISVTLKIGLLTSTFSLIFATTLPRELGQALEWMKVSYRYAFSLSLAFQSLSLIDQEWRSIRESQQARGAWQRPNGLNGLKNSFKDLLSLSVPAIVMTTRRAWVMTEAAYERGFDSPERQPYRNLEMKSIDYLFLVGISIVGIGLTYWRVKSP